MTSYIKGRVQQIQKFASDVYCFYPPGALDPKSKDYDKAAVMRAVFGIAIYLNGNENCEYLHRVPTEEWKTAKEISNEQFLIVIAEDWFVNNDLVKITFWTEWIESEGIPVRDQRVI